MSSNLGFKNSNWIDEAITKKLIKYYKFEHFHNVEEIGCGGFGKVYRANWKNSHKYLALKSFFNFNDITVKAIVHEIQLQREVDFYDNVIRFYGVTTENNSNNYWLVMEYADIEGLRESPVPDTPKDYVKLYTDCWSSEPKERPTINQVADELKAIIAKYDTTIKDIHLDNVNENSQLTADDKQQFISNAVEPIENSHNSSLHGL
ncbi:unnamed protein product [Rhizophagus irregularis]|nr:unnamed protein product [Rhizophagus irregularis]